MKKIVYIVKSKLHYYPPCVSQIKILKELGYNLDVLYGTSHKSIIDELNKENINCIRIKGITDDNLSIFKKLVNWIIFRINLKNKLKEYDRDNTILWFGTAESVMPMIYALKGYKYIVSILELMDQEKLKIKLLKPIVNEAKAVTVCEETRAYIQKYWWKLKELPYVLPNKPYLSKMVDKEIVSNEKIKEILEKIGNREYIIYQGIIQNSEELLEIAKALNNTKKRYVFVLMGIDKYKSLEKIKKEYDDVIYIPYIPAPYHLEITKKARIGITYYRPDDLNRAFCAPNKIYEYTGFGIPILCNDIPGLKNTVGIRGAAKCIVLKENNIVEAINEIEENYNEYKKNAIIFFNSTDNKSTIEKMLGEVKDEN